MELRLPTSVILLCRAKQIWCSARQLHLRWLQVAKFYRTSTKVLPSWHCRSPLSGDPYHHVVVSFTDKLIPSSSSNSSSLESKQRRPPRPASATTTSPAQSRTYSELQLRWPASESRSCLAADAGQSVQQCTDEWSSWRTVARRSVCAGSNECQWWYWYCERYHHQ